MGPFRRIVTRRAGPLGLALTAYDVWKRIPPKHRKMILKQTRKHGPRVASQLLKKRRRP
jgi:hypothetical protein